MPAASWLFPRDLQVSRSPGDCDKARSELCACWDPVSGLQQVSSLSTAASRKQILEAEPLLLADGISSC